ncbi:MAG: tetratricopeptide repeat protein [Imperialibacter sp.]|uniref:tetratricopeptide repeat protein n=1 Tax=Imperialibacter sp. TaxID=2038411 RepID=UPI0032EC261A
MVNADHIVKRVIATGAFALLLVALSFDLQAQGKKKKSRDGVPSEISENDRFQAEYYFVEGEKFFMLEDYAKAYELFSLSNDIDPKSSGVHYKMAQILAESGDFEKALTHANEAIKLDSDNKYYFLLTAEIYTNMSNFQEAASLYERMISTLPNNESYLFDLAALYIYQDKLDKALDVYNRAEDFFGVLEEITYQKQQIFIQQGKIDLAIAEGQKLIDTYPDESDYKLTLAEVLISNQKEKEAIPYLEAVLRDNPSNAQASVRLSEIYRKNGQTEKAMESLHNAFSNPSLNVNAKVQLLAGYIAQLPNPELETAAKELAVDLIEAHPDNVDAQAISGDLEFRLGNKEKARGFYLRALELDNTNYNLWQNVISIEMELEDYQGAAQHAEQAIEIFPNQALLYYFGGTAYLVKKDYRRAANNLEAGKKLATSDPDLSGFIIGQLGDAYNGLEDYPKSDAAYEEALKINSDNDYVLNNYSYYLSLRKEKLDRALELSKRLVEKNPDNGTYLDTHAWVLYVRGDYKESKFYLEKALADSENVSGTIVEHYGDVLFRLGKIDEAVEQWKKAKSMKDTTKLIDKKIADRKLYEE